MFFDRLPAFGLVAALVFVGLGFAPSSALAQSCTQTLSAGANVGSAVSSATGGSTICLNNGNYSGFTLNGVTKTPRVTVRAVNSRSATFTQKITFQGGTNGITIDGVNLGAVDIVGTSTREISLLNFNGTGKIDISGLTSATPNILIDTFAQLNLTLSNADPAGIAVDGNRTTPIATIRNGTIDGGCADGIRIATPVIVENSRIMNKQVGSCPNDPHTDAVQFYGGPVAGTVIRGNYFYRNVQVLAAYDSVEGVLIANNIFDPVRMASGAPARSSCYSDANSIVRHNTVLYRGANYGHICLDRKSQDDAGFGTIVVDNIANSIQANNGSSYSQRRNNLVRTGAVGGDLSGVPTYVGGSAPTTVPGFELATNSVGSGAASSPAGSDIGAIITGSGISAPAAPTNLRISP